MTMPIYMDYAASTPVDERVAAVMNRCLTRDGIFANPASRSHIYGWQAEEQVEIARGHIANLLSCDPREVVWTSGATEATNLALKGVFEGHDFKGHLVTSLIEHKSVIDTAKWLEKKGVAVSWLEPDQRGIISASQVSGALREDTRIVSLMLVNNELGSINPIADIGSVCRQANVLLHVDAAQAVGKLSLDVAALSVDLMSLSAHKFYGPKGAGVLYVRRPVQAQIKAQMHGGGHERGMRSGTLPTHQLAGIGEAARLAAELQVEETALIGHNRKRLWAGIADLAGVKLNTPMEHSSCAHLNVCFGQVDGETLLLSLRQLAVSTGSACASASVEPSYVLKAIGLSDDDADSSIRFSLGRFTTAGDVDQAVEHIRNIYSQLKQAV